MLVGVCLALGSMMAGIGIMLPMSRQVGSRRFMRMGENLSFKIGASIFVAGLIGLAWLLAGPHPKG